MEKGLAMDTNLRMFCFQCQETNHNQGCTLAGRCGKRPETAGEMDRVVAELKCFAQMLQKCGRKPTREQGRSIIQALFATITNANFDTDQITEWVEKVKCMRTQQAMQCGKTEAGEPLAAGVLQIADEDIRSLCELITYGIKGISAYAEHAAVLGLESDSIYAFIVQALATIANEQQNTDFSNKAERVNVLVALVLKTGEVAVQTMEMLDAANTQTFGNPTMTSVRTTPGTRPGILVSGHDLLDLKELLEQTKDAGIDIYTHGEMLPAHGYPELKKYPHLVGNYGRSWFHQPEEFAAFGGPIVMTTNCIVPVKDAYKDRIFTTGVVGYPGVAQIPEREPGKMKDFSEVIKLAKKCPVPMHLPDAGPEMVTGLAHHQVLALADRVVEAVRGGAIRRFVVMAGCDGRHTERVYYTEVAKLLPKDTIILTAGCAKYRYNQLPLGDIGGIPRVLDAGQCNDSYSLVKIAMALKDAFGLKDLNELPVSYDIAWYEQKAVAVLLALLSLGVKGIRLGPTIPAFLTPAVLDVIVKHFDVKPITTPEEDVAAMMCGK